MINLRPSVLNGRATVHVGSNPFRTNGPKCSRGCKPTNWNTTVTAMCQDHIVKTNSLVHGFTGSAKSTRKACLQRNDAINWRQSVFNGQQQQNWNLFYQRYQNLVNQEPRGPCDGAGFDQLLALFGGWWRSISGCHADFCCGGDYYQAQVSQSVIYIYIYIYIYTIHCHTANKVFSIRVQIIINNNNTNVYHYHYRYLK